MLSFLIYTLLLHAERLRLAERAEAEVRRQALFWGENIEERLDVVQLGLKIPAQVVARGLEPDPARFPILARQLMDAAPSVAAVGWSRRTEGEERYRIQLLEAGESSGLSLPPALEEAVADESVALHACRPGLLPARNSGPHYLLLRPALRGESCHGYVFSVLRMDILLAAILDELGTEGLPVVVTGARGERLFATAGESPASWPEYAVEFPGSTLRLQFQHEAEVVPVSHGIGVLLLGLVLSGLLTRNLLERGRREARLHQLLRAYNALNRCNQLLLHATEEATFLRDFCHALVEESGYAFAWIGRAGHDEGKRVEPIAWAGNEAGYLEGLEVSWCDDGRSASPSARAIASGRPCVVNFIHTDPIFLPWRERAAERDFRAMVSLPIRLDGEPFGVLNIYSTEAGAFADAEVLANLETLVGDLAFGLASLRARSAAAAAESTLRLRSEALDASSSGIVVAEVRGRSAPIVYVNRAFERITGYPAEEVLGRNPSFLYGDERDQAGLERIRIALRTARPAEEILRNRRRDGTTFWNRLRLNPLHSGGDEGGPSHWVGVVDDVTEVVEYQQALERQANYDELTGLPNRALLGDRITQAIRRNRRTGDHMAVIFIDLDHFKDINDAYGHEKGDRVLKVLAERLRGVTRDEDTVARHSGDRFVVVTAGPAGDQAALATIQRIHEALEGRPVELEEGGVPLRVTIGVALFPGDGTDPGTLLRNAETALHKAKAEGGNGVVFYTGELNERVRERIEMEDRLRRAIEAGHFLLHYQPRVELGEGRIRGVEALVRWEDPGAGLVPPGRFIPLAEESGLIVPLGWWVLEEACRQGVAWMEAGLPPVSVAVNLSARQLNEPNSAERIRTILRKTGFPARLLELELTESMVAEDLSNAEAILRGFKELGVKLAMDDFGTGYSSLAYLQRLPFDSLKIDRTFVDGVICSSRDAALAEVIVDLGHTFGLQVVAEGVETEGQLAFLRRLGCHEAQGFYLARPLPAAEVERLLERSRVWDPQQEQEGVPEQVVVVLTGGARTGEIREWLEGFSKVSYADCNDAVYESLALGDVSVLVVPCEIVSGDYLHLLRYVHRVYPHVRRLCVQSGSGPLPQDIGELVDRVVNRKEELHSAICSRRALGREGGGEEKVRHRRIVRRCQLRKWE
ncbi:MAG: hypothetical protein Kow006_07720 [Gammaproteobacteria bacterium]